MFKLYDYNRSLVLVATIVWEKSSVVTIETFMLLVERACYADNAIGDGDAVTYTFVPVLHS